MKHLNARQNSCVVNASFYLCLCFQVVWSVLCAASFMAPNGSSTGTWRTSMAWSWWRTKEIPSGRYFLKHGIDCDFPKRRWQTRQAQCSSSEQWVFWLGNLEIFSNPVSYLRGTTGWEPGHSCDFLLWVAFRLVCERLCWTRGYFHFCYHEFRVSEVASESRMHTGHILAVLTQRAGQGPFAASRPSSPSTYPSPLFSPQVLEPVSWLNYIKASSCILKANSCFSFQVPGVTPDCSLP